MLRNGWQLFTSHILQPTSVSEQKQNGQTPVKHYAGLIQDHGKLFF